MAACNKAMQPTSTRHKSMAETTPATQAAPADYAGRHVAPSTHGSPAVSSKRGDLPGAGSRAAQAVEARFEIATQLEAELLALITSQQGSSRWEGHVLPGQGERRVTRNECLRGAEGVPRSRRFLTHRRS